MNQPAVGLLGGRWTEHQKMHLSIDDIGFRQGATGVERLRTYEGNVFCLDRHLDRWEATTSCLGIDGLPLRNAITVLVDELLGRNHEFVDSQGDVGITLLATPGDGDTPTFMMHLNRLDHQRIASRCRTGQSLVTSDISPPLGSCWPRSIKVRSRLHYYLADNSVSKQKDELALLVDHDGMVTETSIANIAIVESGVVVTPTGDRILGGITQSIVRDLAEQVNLTWYESDISRERLASADEILLMGTDGGIWFAHALNGKKMGDGTPGPIYRQLSEVFREFSQNQGR